MSRDKQIEEMAKILCTDYDMGECMVDSFDCLEGHCSKRERIEALYNAGYRKSTDVAEEIFAEIEKIFGVHLWLNATPNEYEDYKELKKKYIGEDTNVTTKESEKDNG